MLVEEPDLLTAVSRIAARLKLAYMPTVAFCERVGVPTLVGAWRPVLLLPLSFASGLEPSQIEAILAHELAHLRRSRSRFVNLLQRVIEALLFFHPALWYVSRRVRIERENCCDDRAIGLAMDPLVYAASLVRVREKLPSLIRSRQGRSPPRRWPLWEVRRTLADASAASWLNTGSRRCASCRFGPPSLLVDFSRWQSR